MSERSDGTHFRKLTRASHEAMVYEGRGRGLAPHAFEGYAVKHFPPFFCLPLVAALAVTNCGAQPSDSNPPQQGGSRARPVHDYASLVDYFRAAGIKVQAEGEVKQPFLSVTGRVIKVHGEDVQVFQYSSAMAMEAQAARISRDGMAVGTSKIHWLGPPHFFKKEKLLVLYIGDEAKTLKALETALGRQFAGQ